MEMQLQEAAKKAQQRKKAETYVVTISRGFGAGGKSVGQLLADTLEVRCCDKYILQEVAKRAHVDQELVRTLDEHVKKIDGHWWQKLLHKDAFSYEDYYQHLVKTVLSITRTGGVIIGRGANLILGAENAFRVRITASPENCARNVASRENISHDDALQRVREVDLERAEYIKMLYDADINDLSNYDLVLNSDRYDRVQLVELILNAMEKAGCSLHADARKSLHTLGE
jgi:cytidylate kinase